MTNVVCIPGVGLGGWAFDAVVGALGDGCRVLERPWSGHPLEVDEQADLIAADIRANEGRTHVVGVSGGATVGLALAVRHPDVLSSAVLHEPLIGAHAPALHAAISGRAALLASADDSVTDELLAALVGTDTWNALTPAQRDGVDRARVRAEVPAFARFSLTEHDAHQLQSLSLTTTIGECSGPERTAVAAWLATHACADVVTLPGAGNSAHLDAPAALAAVVHRQFHDR